ncbi:MAG: type 2 lantipeptide synthetase LanM [Moorea sp. SIO3B2]|nr:type 2 lantipeptide synthetase LanM [Moorena sp. SIO3B2]NEP63945.1 type 2 lantipeptide synthetase LanM [Moorena sp. SIO3A5]NER87047.1 type 2 lantipeptide synthetase LanM [Moorena sp. SIO3A2]OLT65638.1 lanthionine synthetase [Moorena producens 3L]
MEITAVELSQIATIATNAAFLSECLNCPFERDFNPHKLDQNLIEERLKTWCKLLGGEDRLKKRLQWNGWDLNTVRILLGTADVIDNPTLPPWAETLKELIESGAITLLGIEGEYKSPIDSQNPLPFEDFYLPFILVAQRKLYTGLSATRPLELLSREAWKALERSLLQKLVDLGAKTLLFEFYKFRESQPSYEKIDSQESQSKALYCALIQNLLQDGGLAFFQQYPVLARLIATTINLWVESTTEFIQRLQEDLSAIELIFSDRKSLGKVENVETAFSEPHNGGRSVSVLTFSSGVKVVYKPKDLGLDVAFNQLLDWCNQKDTSLPFQLTKILNRQGYGWVKFVEQQPCEDKAAVQRFYKRAGMLLSLLYVLGSSKSHKTNVIASREYPIIINVDTLMSPIEKSFSESENWFKYSVIKTGFLPSWEGNLASANTRDYSDIGGIYPQQINSSIEWKFINTDGMQLTPKTTIIPPRNNVVVLEEETVCPNDYLEEVVTGFEEMYRLLIKHRETLLTENSILSGLKSLNSRFILRPARAYSVICKHSLNPQYLRSGVDYSIGIDTLSRTYLTAEEKPEAWVTLPAEIKSLQQQDIPYFTVSCNKDTLDVGLDQPIKHFFKTSSYQQLISRLQSLDQQDLALQIKLIRGSFLARFAHLTKKNVAPQADSYQFLPLTPEQLQQEALSIGNRLIANAIINNDSCNWIAIEYMFNAKRYQLQALDDSLYQGRAGVSLFLAALAKLTGKSEFQKVALAALSPLRQSLQNTKTTGRLIQSGLGVAGLGGIIYSLVKISQFLQEPALLKDAQQAAKLISPQAIAGDQTLDILGGVAGAILGLLSLYQETGEPAILDTAIACGNRLLSKRSNTVPRAWKTICKIPLTGFSHGAAGNALALLRLYAATADTAYLEAAQEGIEYERSVFDQSARNWPDFRFLEKTNQISFMHTWCHGSVGIGLARLASLSILKIEENYADIEIALETTQNYSRPSRDIDHLCCGILGRTELFVVASQKLGNQNWLKTARKQAAWVVERSKEHGGYTFFFDFPNSLFNPSFFRGTAGVGYQLLRLASPELLPSVLIWE